MGQKVHSKGFRFGQNSSVVFISKGKLYPFRFLNNEKLVGFNDLTNTTLYGDFQQKHLLIKKIVSFFFRINQLYINNISLLQTISGLFVFIEFYRCKDSTWIIQKNKFKFFISLIKKHLEIIFNNSIPVFFLIAELTTSTSVSLPFSAQAMRFKGGQDLFRCLYLIQFFPLSRSLSLIVAKCLEQSANQQIVISFLKTILDFLFLNKDSKLKGCFVQIKGRIGGSDRTRKIVCKVGTLPLQKKTACIDFFITEALTIYGLFSIKVWAFYR